MGVGVRALLGAGFLQGRGLVRAGLGRSEVWLKWSSLGDGARKDWGREGEAKAGRKG